VAEAGAKASQTQQALEAEQAQVGGSLKWGWFLCRKRAMVD
jgi:hypothetical protein